jgi:DNA-binding beta-propeller fold protein YncE
MALGCLVALFMGAGATGRSPTVPIVNATVTTISNVTTPQGVALNTDRTRLYVAETTARTTWDPLAKQCKDGGPPSPGTAGAVGIFDTGNRSRLADLLLRAGSPVHVELDPSSGRVYVAGSPGGIYAFQGTSQVGMIPMGGAPHDIGIDPTNEHAVVTNTFDVSGNPANQTYVSLVDLSSGQILTNVNTGNVGPHKAAVDPSRHLVYISHAVSPAVDVIDTQTGRLLRQFATGLAQGGAYNAIDLSRQRLYVVGAMTTSPTSPDALVAIDLTTGKRVAGEVQLSKGAHGIRVDPVTGLMWVVLGDAGQVAVIDPSTLTERALIPVGHCPYYLDIDPVRRLAYVTNEADNSITVLDMAKVPATARCVVPNVQGKTLAAAERTLTARRCVTGKITRGHSAKFKTGRVISQRPAPGAKLGEGGRVNLVINRR